MPEERTQDDAALLTVDQVAALFGVKPHTIRTWLCRRDPRIPEPIRWNRNFVRFRRGDVLRRVAQMQSGAIKPIGRRRVTKGRADQ